MEAGAIAPMGRWMERVRGTPAGLAQAAAFRLRLADPDTATAGVVTDVETAYSAFFRQEFARVVRTIHLIVRDEAKAEDVAQDAFLRLFQNWPKVSQFDRPEAWVRRIAIRIAMRGRRRDQLWTALRVKLVPTHDVPPPNLDVADAIGRLPASQRAAIALYYYEDRPVAHIAAILGCTESTARVHLHHGRKRLAQLLGDEAGDVA
jgi:RNA polymerase sigma-70 factor (ECF subfamily)